MLIVRMSKLRLMTPPTTAAARREQQRQRPAEAEGAHHAIAQETRILLRDKVVVREGLREDAHVGSWGWRCRREVRDVRIFGFFIIIDCVINFFVLLYCKHHDSGTLLQTFVHPSVLTHVGL